MTRKEEFLRQVKKLEVIVYIVYYYIISGHTQKQLSCTKPVVHLRYISGINVICRTCMSNTSVNYLHHSALFHLA